MIANKLEITNKLKDSNFNLGRGSYNNFFQFFNDKLEEKGLHLLLNQQFPIVDTHHGIHVTYHGYDSESSIYDEQLYTSRYLSYAVKLKIYLKFNINDQVVDHTFILQNVPIMVNNSYFVINGTKKIMIYQLIKTGGIYHEVCSSTHRVHVLRIVSLSGSRVELKINQREIIQVYVNSSKKIQISDFFNLINESKLLKYIEYYKKSEDIELFKVTKNITIKHILLFADTFQCKITNKGIYIQCTKEQAENYLIAKWNKYEYDEINKIAFVKLEDLYNCIVAIKTKSSSIEKKHKVIEIKECSVIENVLKTKISLTSDDVYINIKLLFFPSSANVICRSFLHYIDKNAFDANETAEKDSTSEEKVSDDADDTYDDDEVAKESTKESEEDFEEDDTYTSSPSIEYIIDKVIRKRINQHLNCKYATEELKFTEEDFVLLFIYFNKLMLKQNFKKQDYDELTYKRVKRPEDFIANIILRSINKLRANTKYLLINKENKYNFDDFLGAYNCSSEIRKIFSTHPLVQFLDQTNILAEFSHRRRISVFNLVNSEKYQVSFEGRDINPTYYGRICPIETPEGCNVGLVNAIALNAKINDYGFILTPYLVVKDGIITDEVHFLSTEDEMNKFIACFQKNFKVNVKVLCRYNGEIIETDKSNISYSDYDNRSILSAASCLIPGIHHNDARRALMGANMQRQAIPLLKQQSPIAGTGVEKLIARNTNSIIYNDTDNQVVVRATSGYVILANQEGLKDFKVYVMNKFMKTNMKTCSNMVTAVKNNELINQNNIIASGSCIDKEELAIGQNVLVAFISLYGFEFEDSIVISEKLRRDGYFASIHMDEVEVKAKEIDVDIVEKITIDNLNEKVRNLKYLDNKGIVKVGTKIKPNDVLVSRIIPIEGDVSLEDNVLAVIFGKEISDYKDISYKATYDISGTVIGINYFNRTTNTQDSTYCNNLTNMELDIQKCILTNLIDQLDQSSKIKYTLLLDETTNFKEIIKIITAISNKKLNEELKKNVQHISEIIKQRIEKHKKIIKVSKCCNIENNVAEYVKIIIAEKRIIGIGDKLSGRHGNKGVVSNILPIEDMPYLDDGTPVDILLNPIGIQNRLNIGQILESTCGLTSYLLKEKVKILLKVNNVQDAKILVENYMKFKIHRNSELDIDSAIELMEANNCITLALPVFNSISFKEVKAILKLLDCKEDATFKLRCGIEGEYFNRKVHVGVSYIMKLNHMATDKISARETGGYSTILQQPLPRKANYGGQRFGEMEVWAVEAYGAAKVLLEILGPKSDDIGARNEMYENIFKRKHLFTTHLCETVNVIIRYLNGACIKLDFIKNLEQTIKQNI